MYGNNNNPAPGTAGGRCRRAGSGRLVMPCDQGLNCTTSGDLGVPRCMAPAPGPRPGPRPSRKGYGDLCTPGAFPGSGLQANCKKGLVCKRSSPDVMPVCQYPSVKPNPPRPLGTFSYECEGTQCVLKKSPPNLKENRYSSLERCQAYCAPHHPPGFLKTYDCNPRRGYDGGGPDCIARDDGRGRFESLADCNKMCRSARLRKATYDCNPQRTDTLGSKACVARYDGLGMWQSESECEQSQTCKAATLRMGYSCPAGTKVGGGNCKKVPGVPNGRSVHATQEACAQGSTCHPLPTSLMREPAWTVGSAESNPLSFMMSNVGDVHSRIHNYMGE